MKTKIKKRIIGKAISLALAICTLFSLLASTHIYASEKDTPKENNTDTIYTACDEASNNIYLETDCQQCFPNDKTINLSFAICSDSDILSIDYDATGFTVLDCFINDNGKIEFELSIVEEAIDCYLTVDLILSNSISISSCAYGLNTEYGCFINPYSQECAANSYYKFLVENNYITEEEALELRNQSNQSIVEQSQIISYFDNTVNNQVSSISPYANVGSGDTKVIINAKWYDDAGNLHPLYGAKVVLYDKNLLNNRVLLTGQTDTYGNVTFIFENADRVIDLENGGYDIFFRIYPCDTNSKVKLVDENGDDYYYEKTTVLENIQTGTEVTYNCNIKMTSDASNNNRSHLGQAFQVFQAMYYSYKYASARVSTIDNVTVYYPLASSSGGCAYYPSNKTIRILYQNGGSTSPNSYAAWDTIMHEYGHHIENQLGIAEFTGKQHNSADNLADIYGKSIGIKLAWAEGWATTFGLMTQKYFSSHLTNISTVRDTLYTDYKGISYDVENQSQIRKGEACERTVMSILWDIYDNVSDSNGYDKISLGDAIWNVFKMGTTNNSGAKTFNDFYNNFFDAQGLTKILDLAPNLTYYFVSTGTPTVISGTGTSASNPIGIRWEKQGGSATYTNNEFMISVFDGNNNEIFFVTEITANTYTFSLSDWTTILNRCNGTVKFSIVAFQTTTPETGWYYSNLRSHTIP